MNRSFAARPESVAAARTLVTGWLRGWMPGDERTIDDVALAVSEACANAVVHAYRDGHGSDEETFTIVADRDDGAVRVTVSDHGCGLIPRSDSPGLGLGLPLITSLADSLEMRSPARGSGTVVAMRFSPGLSEPRSPS